MSENSSIGNDILSNPIAIGGILIALFLFIFFEEHGGFDFYYQNTILPFLYQLKIWTIRIAIVLVVLVILYFVGKNIFNNWQDSKIRKEESEQRRIEERKRMIEDEKKRKQELAEDKLRRERRMIFESKVKDVLDYFFEKKSSKSISFKHKDYDRDIIQEAERRYNAYWSDYYEKEREEADAQRERRECYLFVYKNHGLPSDFDSRSNRKQKFDLEAETLFKQGKLNKLVRDEFKIPQESDYESIGGEEKVKELKEKDFYLASSLKPLEMDFLTRFEGYTLENTDNFGDGFIEVVIKCPERETSRHFILKNLFAKTHESAIMEYTPAKGFAQFNEARADVAFLLKNLKIAVEIERGTNKNSDLREKINSLRQHFDRIVLVVTRDLKKRYKRFKEKNVVFVLTPKEAKEQILNWIKTEHLLAPRKKAQKQEKPS